MAWIGPHSVMIFPGVPIRSRPVGTPSAIGPLPSVLIPLASKDARWKRCGTTRHSITRSAGVASTTHVRSEATLPGFGRGRIDALESGTAKGRRAPLWRHPCGSPPQGSLPLCPPPLGGTPRGDLVLEGPREDAQEHHHQERHKRRRLVRRPRTPMGRPGPRAGRWGVSHPTYFFLEYVSFNGQLRCLRDAEG